MMGLASVGVGIAAHQTSSDSNVIAPISSAACAARHADWPPPILTNDKVYARLQSKMETITPVARGLVKEYHVNQYAANPIIEDTVSVVPAVSCPPGGFLFGVFDGTSRSRLNQHGTVDAAVSLTLFHLVTCRPFW